MRLKTFMGKTMSEVMTQIRRELGPDAVIISNLQEKNGVRVTAAIEQLPSPQPLKHIYSEASLPPLDSFLSLFEHQRLPQEVLDEILRRFTSMDKEIVRKGPSAILENLFSYYPLPHPWADKGGVIQPIMLIGPTGAGKTLATAKLAFEYMMAGWRVGIVTTDGEKAGAHAQLTRFTEALGIPLIFAKDAEELYACLKNDYADYLLFVDTTGLNPLDQSNMNCLKEMAGVFQHAPTLVIPAGLDAYEAMDICGSVKELGVKRFIHTKVDCSQRFGAMISIMVQQQMHLASLGSGPELSSRLIPASPAAVIKLLQKSSLKNSANNQDFRLQDIAKPQEVRS